MTTGTDERAARGQPQWQWIALGLAATFVLTFTIVGAVAIYTFGWRSRGDDRRLAEAYAAVATRSGLCPSGQVCTLEALTPVAGSIWKVQLGGPTTRCGLVDTHSFTFAVNGAVTAGLAPISCSGSAVPVKTVDTLTVGGPIGIAMLERPAGAGGAPTGFEAAVVAQIAAHLGIANVGWVDTATTPFATVERRSDFLTGYVVNGSSGSVAYSTPILNDDFGLLVRAGSAATHTTTFTQAGRLKIGVGDSTAALLVRQTIRPRIATKSFASPQAAVLALKRGNVDAVLLDVPLYSTYAGPGLTYAARLDTSSTIALAFQPGNPLLPFVNSALAKMRSDGTLKSLTKTWFGSSAGARYLKR